MFIIFYVLLIFISSVECLNDLWNFFSDHQFYHKWAVLLDPNDVEAGPKGYIKCDITISGRGQTVKVRKVLLTQVESGEYQGLDVK